MMRYQGLYYILFQLQMTAKQQIRSDKNDNFYPYLSVDPKNNPHNYHEIFNSESLDYLNIKFDTKSQLRETYIRNFKNKLAPKLFRESNQSLSVKNQDQLNDKKLAIVKKKVLNPQQLIHSQGLKNIKESVFLHQHRISSYHQKKSINYLQEMKPNDGNPISKPKCFTFNQLNSSNEQQKSVKPKRQIYQKMLKKVDQLREIYKYETQLMSITQIKDQIPIRFHTEPIMIEINQKQEKIRPVIKKHSKNTNMPHRLSPQNRDSLYQVSNQQKTNTSQNKTLDVRKYRNQTSIKKRLKYLLRRQMMKQQFSLSDKKSITEQKTNKTKQKGPKVNDKDVVGPWDAEQSIYFLKYQ